MSSYRWGGFVVALAIVAITFAGCGGTSGPATTPRAPAPPPAPPRGTGARSTGSRWSTSKLSGSSPSPRSTGSTTPRFPPSEDTPGSPIPPVGLSGLRNVYYCYADAGVYYHDPFLDHYADEVGELGAVIIIAHEFGHHVGSKLGWSPGYNHVHEAERGSSRLFRQDLGIGGRGTRGALSGEPQRGCSDPHQHRESAARMVRSRRPRHSDPAPQCVHGRISLSPGLHRFLVARTVAAAVTWFG